MDDYEVEEEYVEENTIIDLDDDFFDSGDSDDFVWHPAAADGPLSVEFSY